MADVVLSTSLTLEGCQPTPLAGYLKALGVLRVLSDQADSGALGWWCKDRFVLRTALARDSLVRFFLVDYVPTPIIAPWNSGSGFYPKDQQAGLGAIAGGHARRLGPLREAIALGRRLIVERALVERPVGEAKTELIAALRAQGSTGFVAWIDAAVAVTLERTVYAPLLGTGGNDGRLDFTNNFMQRLVELFSPESGDPSSHADQELRASLFGEPAAGLGRGAVGQFAPGAAGGPNSHAGATGEALGNRWDFVLMLEGAVTFAGAIARRLESNAESSLSSPFTVRATAAGFGTATRSEQKSDQARGEVWAPLWERPASAIEVRALFREGRLAVGGRTARDGLDAARAISGLGCDRQIAAFARYSFVKRQGKAFLAIPAGRHAVGSNPRSELISELDRGGWLAKIRRAVEDDHSPAGPQRAVRGLEEAVLSMVAAAGGRDEVQQVLVSVGAVARAVAVRPRLRESVPPPPRLSAEWLAAADDETPEFRLAAAVAGLGCPDSSRATTEGHRLPMMAHLGPLKPSVADSRREWAGDAAIGAARAHVVWREGDLVSNLVAVARRRLVHQAQQSSDNQMFHGGSSRARIEDIAAFLTGIDDGRMAALVQGLAWVAQGPLPRPGQPHASAVCFAYAAIRPLCAPSSVLTVACRPPSPSAQATETSSSEMEASSPPVRDVPLRLPLPPDLFALLAAGRVHDATQLAQRRAHGAGLPVPFLGEGERRRTWRAPTPRAGRRLLAALCIPVAPAVIRACLRQAYPSFDKETDHVA